MKRIVYILVLVGIHSLVYGQFVDTTTMTTIEQNRTAAEGDMYLDTNALVYKIGLTMGKLGWLTDNQSIDSIRTEGDSLFIFLKRGGKFGIPTDSLFLDRTIGMQYYTWERPISSSPNIDFIKELGISSTQGQVKQELNDDMRINLAPTSGGYIFYFVGKIDISSAGNYRFNSRSNDGARLYVNDVLVIDNWSVRNFTSTNSESVFMPEGEHKVEIWYFSDGGGSSFMEFFWGANPAGYSGMIKASQFKVK